MKIKFIQLLFLHLIFYLPITISQPLQFTDVANAMGINPPIQFIRGSVSFCDFNGDGFDDLSFSTAENFPLFIYASHGVLFSDETANLGLTNTDRQMQLLWADYDNDGDKDLFMAIDDENHYSHLYKNDNGVLTDVTLTSGIGTVPSSCNAAAWADYDNDGWLDLFVTHYSEFTANYLYRNNGDGTFADVTTSAGVTGFDSQTGFYKLALAVAFYDFDNDGWLDIHICNDHFTGDYHYRNNGDGTFTEIGELSGAGVRGFMMGVAVGDYDDNGFLDLYLSNDPFGNYFLRNNADGTFTDVAEDLGMTVNKSCWGTNFFDHDNDGDLDLYVCAEIGTNPFFDNNGDGTFTQLVGIGLDGNYKSFGCGVGDFDNNGYTDIAVHNQQSPVNLYKNAGGLNNWVKLNLLGVIANRDGIGARIESYINGSRKIRETTCGISYMSQNSNSTIIGTGSSTTIDSIIIKWPGSGIIDVLRNVSVNQSITVTEGETVVGAGNEISLPDNFILQQNYPNPFNPVTSINIEVPIDSKVSITIYNVLGEKITTLIDVYLNAGLHQVEFSADGLNSGVYFYKLDATGNNGVRFSDVKKMMLTK
jgi:hypothetical protein